MATNTTKAQLAAQIHARERVPLPGAWAELFGGDSVVAAAVLDRLLDGATVINIKGGSWRLREHQALTQPLAQLNDPPESPPKRRR